MRGKGRREREGRQREVVGRGMRRRGKGEGGGRKRGGWKRGEVRKRSGWEERRGHEG